MRFYFKTSYLIILVLTTCTAIQCSRTLSQREQEKIRLDYSNIDAAGLRNGEVAVDYEFCIPAHDDTLNEVKAIEPDVRVLKQAKGRIRCSESEWLCIVNTHDPQWRDKLFAIAALNYVDRIGETFYE